MPGGGNTQTSSQTSSSGPWKPTQPYLRDALSEAERLYDADKGFKPFPGQGYVPFSDQSQNALGSMESMASQPNPFYGGASDFTNSLISGGQNLDQSGFRSLLGQGPSAVGQYGTDIASGAQSQNALSQYGTGIASGAQGINTEGDYRSLYDSIDPGFDAVVDKQAGRLSDDIARQFGGASFGSAASTGALVDQVGDYRERMASNQFNQNLAHKTGLLGQITGVQGSNLDRQLGAAGMLSGEQGANIGNRLNAAGLLSNEQMQGLGLQRGLYGDIANLEQGDIANRMGGLGMMDQVYNSQYLPAERMAGVGAAYEGKAGEKLQSQMDKFNIKQMAPWDRLAQAYGMFSGTGAQGNRVQSSISQPTDPWSKLLGGGLLASQIFG